MFDRCACDGAAQWPIVTFSRLPFRWYLKRQVLLPDGSTSSGRPPPSVSVQAFSRGSALLIVAG